MEDLNTYQQQLLFWSDEFACYLIHPHSTTCGPPTVAKLHLPGCPDMGVEVLQQLESPRLT